MKINDILSYIMGFYFYFYEKNVLELSEIV